MDFGLNFNLKYLVKQSWRDLPKLHQHLQAYWIFVQKDHCLMDSIHLQTQVTDYATIIAAMKILFNPKIMFTILEPHLNKYLQAFLLNEWFHHLP